MNEASPLKWYQKGWGIALAGFGLLAGGVMIIIVGLTIHYLWKITQGQGEHLFLQFSSPAFTPVEKHVTVVNPSTISRGELEGGSFPALGTNNPKVTIVEFFDFRCPYCKQAAPIMEQVMKEYGDKVKLIVRHFPVESLHPGATNLARLGHCAGIQGRFWPIYSYLYSNQDTIPETVTDQVLKDIAGKHDIDMQIFEKCLSDPATLIAINKDYADGFRFGVEGTPTFFVNGERVLGVVPLEVWRSFLKNL